MPSNFRCCRAAWLMLFALAGCSTAGGKINIYTEGNSLDDCAKFVRDASEPPIGIGRELDKRPGEEYRVEPGDVLLVQTVDIAGSLRLPGDQAVLTDGTIRLGPLGTLLVMNMTVAEIQDAVDARARQMNYSEKIMVRLVTRDSKVFYVLGEVNAPGSFQLKGRETVLDALLAAGGLNTNGSRKHIVLVRPTAPDGCRIVLGVRYNAIVQLGDTTTNYQIRAGDRIYVPARGCWEDFLGLFGAKKGCGAAPCYPRGGCAPAEMAVPVASGN